MELESFSLGANHDLNAYKKLEPKKILVVEDDKNMTVFLGKAILDLTNDAEINWATSLEQAVTKLIQDTDISKGTPYDLIIADIFLEGSGTGLDLFKVISEIYPKIPFLVISSMPYEQMSESLEKAKKEKLFYLRKPFLYSQCKEKIKNILINC